MVQIPYGFNISIYIYVRIYISLYYGTLNQIPEHQPSFEPLGCGGGASKPRERCTAGLRVPVWSDSNHKETGCY